METELRNIEWKQEFNKAWYDFRFAGDLNDLNMMVDVAEQAYLNLPDHHPDQQKWLQKLVNTLYRRYMTSRNLSDLEVVSTLSDLQLSRLPVDSPERDSLVAFQFFIRTLQQFIPEERHQFTRENAAGLDAFRQAAIENLPGPQDLEALLSSMPVSDSVNPSVCMAYASSMLLQYSKNANTEYLNKAYLWALEAVHSEDSVEPVHLVQFARILARKFSHWGNLSDLNEAVQNAERGVNNAEETDEFFHWMVSELSKILELRYDSLGDPKDIDKAVTEAQRAYDKVPPASVHERASEGVRLASLLSRRSMNFGTSDDLELAIELVKEAIGDLRGDDTESSQKWLRTLGSLSSQKFERTGDSQDLRLAETLLLDSSEDGAAHGIDSDKDFEDIQILFFQREQETGTRMWRDFAIMMSEILSLRQSRKVSENQAEGEYDTARNGPSSANIRYHLGIGLLRRYVDPTNDEILHSQGTTKAEVLAKAISHLEAANSLTREDDPEQAIISNSLAAAYLQQYWQTNAHEDRDRALKCFKVSVNASRSKPLGRIRAAREAISVMIGEGLTKDAMLLSKEAVDLLPRLCSRLMSRDDQQHAILSVSGLVADACSLSLWGSDLEEALKRAEFGRCMILGHLMDGRSDLTELKKRNPKLAEHYDQVRFKAFQRVNETEPAIRGRLLKERQVAVRQLDELEATIREQENFKDFLTLPSVNELKQCADHGPIVIINVTNLRADAIIVTTSSIKAIELPAMKKSGQAFIRPETAICRGGAMEQVLGIGKERPAYPESKGNLERSMRERYSQQKDLPDWLWSTCVQYILKELDSSDDTPHVWWIGMGQASSLPFHAARSRKADPSQDCLIRVVSSYTPNIKALRYARTRASMIRNDVPEKPKVLVVSMPTTPSHDPLDGVEQESQTIVETVAQKFEPILFRHPTAFDVLQMIGECDIAHFACHGHADLMDPSESHLLLQAKDELGDSRNEVDRMTVGALLDSNNSGRTWLAYLSACSTAQNRTAQLADENIHLASAFQVAGFPHVIGSLWPTMDDTCVSVAKLFYECLLQSQEKVDPDKAIAEALRTATLKIREDDPDNFNAWAPYIHLGA